MRRSLPQVRRKRDAVLLSVLCFSVYMVSYIGRLNYSAALTEMTAAGVLSKTQGGAIATAYFLCYGAGQMFNGFLADRSWPVWQVTAGIAGSVALNLLMPFARSWRLMVILWGANGYSQSLIWAPSFRMISQSISFVWRAKALLLLNMASPAGTVAAYLFSSLVLASGDWRQVFNGAAVCMGLFALLWVLVSRRIYRGAEAPVPSEMEMPAPEQGGKGEPIFPLLIGSCAIYLVLPSVIHGMLKDGITNWLPVYMSEVFSLSSQRAVAWSIFLPIINMLGAVVAYFLMRRTRNEVLSAAIVFTGSTASLALLWLFGSHSPMFTVLLFSLVTMGMTAANVLFCSEVPSRFSYAGRAAAVSGFFNSSAYIGSAASMYAVAWISQRYGWTVTQLIWIGVCALGILCCARAIPGWERFLDARQVLMRQK
ncbi:MFS transporter [Oscillibacter sp.]|uniref:MFS transporter n=1 Tax=Oscillibacter sp. TaxID=1945593 RepID=UPI002D804AA4|nr:MFS transporter [Oscillibacter sp.]